jgi:hypothetical protein
MTPVIARRLHEVAQRAARAWDDNDVALGRYSTFAVKPNNFAIALAACDAVVAAVPETFGFRSERGNETTRNEFAVRPGPADGEVVPVEIVLRGKRICFDAFTEVLVCMCAQNGFTQSSRAAVNEHDELLLAEVEVFELPGVEDVLDRLQLGEVIATTDGA